MADKVRRAVAQQLEAWQAAGVTHVRKGRAIPVTQVPPAVVKSTPMPKASAAPPAVMQPAQLLATGIAGPNLSLEQKVAALEIVQREVAGCTRCSELASTRTQTVFGVGNPQARLCFVGEAPGADEDEQGEPFVGKAGQKLNEIITKGMKIKREDVYILNVLKCRPPGNRTPAEDEVAHCRGYLDRQLEILRPEFICCLGAVAAQTILSSTVSIGRLRGKFHDYRGIPVLCTYHPSYLLRNPAARKDVWEDIQILMARMGMTGDRPLPS